MPSFYGPPWGPAGRRRAATNPSLRVSDADRSAVADQLSKHYADGRLDQEEFSERMERAMSAKTQADLAGLLGDLPAIDEPAGAVRQRRPGFPLRFLVLVVLILLAAAAWHGITDSFFFFPFFFIPVPWLLIGAVVFLWLRHRRQGRWGGPGTP